MAKACKRCGSEITGRVKTATLCWECAHSNSRVSSLDARRVGNFDRIVIDGKVFCVDCKEEIVFAYKRKQGGVPMRCNKCRSVRNSKKEIQAVAHKELSKAVRLGNLQKPSNFACADCGKPAECYDHRDYSKPLDVEPVCISCNIIRGPAINFLDAA